MGIRVGGAQEGRGVAMRHRVALALLICVVIFQAAADSDGNGDAVQTGQQGMIGSLKRTVTAQGKTRGPQGEFACRCAGKKDQTGQGAACERYGFRTTWCYVEAACKDKGAVPAPGMGSME